MADEQRKNPPGAGKSSYELINPEILFHEMHISRGMTILDLGCGKGNYSTAVSSRIGTHGLVHAVDLWEEGISILQQRIAKEGYTNIRPIVADIGGRIPIEDRSVDACLIATVLHDLVEIGVHDNALKEAARVLKTGATLAVVEFKKVEGPPGPPMSIRLAPEETEQLVFPKGFTRMGFAEIGPYHYLLTFRKAVGDI